MKKFIRLLIFVFIVGFASAYIINALEVLHKDDIDFFCEEYMLPKSLVYAVIKTESGFEKEALSPKGAVGLMQITPETAKWCSEKLDRAELYDFMAEPSFNIELGCFYLSYLLERYDGSETAALAAYNAGAGNVDKWLCDENYSDDGKTLKACPYPETDRYLKKVSFYKKIYRILYRT